MQSRFRGIAINWLFVYFALLLSLTGCNQQQGNNLNVKVESKTIIGSWKYVTASKTPLELEALPRPDEENRYIIFKSDNSFEAKIFTLGSSDSKPKVGTYKVVDDILTLYSSGTDKSDARISIKFDKDFLIMYWLDDGLIWYLKRPM